MTPKPFKREKEREKKKCNGQWEGQYLKWHVERIECIIIIINNFCIVLLIKDVSGSIPAKKIC